MSEYTSAFNMKLPDETDYFDIEDFNGNTRIIDEKLSDLEEKIEDLREHVTKFEQTGYPVASIEQADLQASRRSFPIPQHSKAIRQLTFLPTMMMICRFNFNFEYFVNFSRELHSCVHFFDLLGGIMKGGFKNGIY